MKPNRGPMFRLAATSAVVAALTLAQTHPSPVAQVGGEKENAPDSVDPLLRVVPLERERIRPERTPGLQIPPKPGFQAVVMHEYGTFAEQTDIVRPVLLYVPDRFYRQTSQKPYEVWSLNFFLLWPGLNPVQDHPECIRLACDGLLLLRISLTHGNTPQTKYHMLLDRIKFEKAKSNSIIGYETADPPPGFAESYITTITRPTSTKILRERFFIARGADKKIISYTVCSIDVLKPGCRTDIMSKAFPEINILYDINMNIFLSQNDILQRKAEDFVDSLVEKKL